MPDATLIYHDAHMAADAFTAPALAEPADIRLWRSAHELFTDDAVPPDAPVVLLADDDLLVQHADLSALPPYVVVVATDAASAGHLGARADVSMMDAPSSVVRRELLDAACALAMTRFELARARRKLSRVERDLRDLSKIGMALMLERDRAALLHLILDGGKQLTASDGAGLLLLETKSEGVAELVPVHYEVDSLPDLGVPAIRYPIDGTSIVGQAARTKEPVVVDDVHRLPANADFVGSEEFQRRFRYHTQSVLAVPMLDQHDVVLGVIFFMNRKSRPVNVRTKRDAERYVLPYGEREVYLARALASQAAASIENTRLHAQIEALLDSMVSAAVSAIDERDPATAGHSQRVACLTTDLAEAVSRANTGPYQAVRYTPTQIRELRFAALLHDLGKVRVREEVLLKAHKLPDVLLERIDARFAFIRRTMELEITEQHEELSREGGSDASAMERLDAKLAAQLRDLNRFRDVIRRANEPISIDASLAAELEEIAKRTYRDVEGAAAPYLQPDEMHYLTIPCGTLDDEERAEVEAHVTHTRRFLSQIAWTRDLENLVRFACAHHEKLNGTGYPDRLRRDEIPIETRMITLADIYDALTEAERPYKHQMTREKAIEIMRRDAEAGLLDADLIDILETDVAH